MRHDAADVKRASKLFKALSNPSRLEIACRLVDCKPKTQKELIDELGWPQSSMARHLTPLRDLGLVQAERDGVEVRLSVRSPVFKNLFQSVCLWLDETSHGAPASRAKRRAR